MISYKPPDEAGEFELDLFGSSKKTIEGDSQAGRENALPSYANDIKESLEAVLDTSKLSLWLMVDRLDEIFPRRSEVERTALRGILRAMRYFASPKVRVKVFLRDDMLEQVVKGQEGFTATWRVSFDASRCSQFPACRRCNPGCCAAAATPQ